MLSMLLLDNLPSLYPVPCLLDVLLSIILTHSTSLMARGDADLFVRGSLALVTPSLLLEVSSEVAAICCGRDAVHRLLDRHQPESRRDSGPSSQTGAGGSATEARE